MKSFLLFLATLLALGTTVTARAESTVPTDYKKRIESFIRASRPAMHEFTFDYDQPIRVSVGDSKTEEYAVRCHWTPGRTLMVITSTFFFDDDKMREAGPDEKIEWVSGEPVPESRKPSPTANHDSKNNWAVLNGTGWMEGSWRPDEAAVPLMLTRARLHLEELQRTTTESYRKNEIAKILSRWDQYACQVLGHTKQGRKLIHLNFFPAADIAEEFSHWRSQYVSVSDGGAGFWHLEYDPEANVFLDFESNGYA